MLGVLFRFIRIQLTVFRYLLRRDMFPLPRAFFVLSYLNPLSYRSLRCSRGVHLREMLITLGPLFIKLGQVLSTRPDWLPEDIVRDLSLLQDQVPPFDGEAAMMVVERALKQPCATLFATFDKAPLASASIAQVHAATRWDGADVVVKILRPGIAHQIKRDIRVLYALARCVVRCSPASRRLQPVAMVSECEDTLLGEIDLMQEAANASTLRRHFQDSPIMDVPAIYWDQTCREVMVMARVYGVPIDDLETFAREKTNMKVLAERGVEIFFTQVFRDRFFHADMHPGNLFVDVSDPENPRYKGVDFGIMGTLGPDEQHYLAQNMLAFFRRDYRRIAELHIESGWVNPHTRPDQFESAIRAVSEPIFEMPLSEISFGELLLRLFQTAARFDMTVQPALLLLQKTLFNIEGLGRMLYPELDLWTTAKPFMERWAREQSGYRYVRDQLKASAQPLLDATLTMPVVATALLKRWNQESNQAAFDRAHPAARKRSPGFYLGVGGVCVGALALALPQTMALLAGSAAWALVGLGAGLLLRGR